MYISRSNTSSVELEPKHIGSPRSKHSKISIQIPQIEMRSQLRRQGQLLGAILFEAFPYFECFRILANAANFYKILFDKFHVRQV